MATPPRVLILEDHDLLAQSLAALLRGEGLLVEVARPAAARSAAGPGPDEPYDVVLLDLDQCREDAPERIRSLRADGARVVILTGSADVPPAAVTAHAAGVIRTDEDGDTVRRRIREAVGHRG